MMYAEFRALSSLEKLFVDQTPLAPAPITEGFLNEAISYQLAAILRNAERNSFVKVHIISPAADHVQIRMVQHVPVTLPCYSDTDDNYLRKDAGMYPDLLIPYEEHHLRLYTNRWVCLWITFDAKGKLPAGAYPVTVRILTENDILLGEHTQMITLLPAMLPEQKLIHTKWFHVDCLADYYHVPVFSEEHWRIIENFARSAVEGGMNMLLMPVHTLPLDTRIGGERTTTQLVGITLEDGIYHFDMALVHRWIAMCRKIGVRYYEIAHLYTQWGAEHAPKIVANVDGQEKRIFGWETDATGEDYCAFLRAYIPALRKVFQEEGIEDRVYWHISDEPSVEHLPAYLAAKKQIEHELADANIMDALSNKDFYDQGILEHPAVASDHIQPFLDDHVPGLWMYYCCAQHFRVSNLYIAMPSARCRILGAQLFRYQIVGFLQWGYNFYNAQYSNYRIDPYATTDADGWVPAGDPFQVYPGEDGHPVPSIRWMVVREAMQDLRALELLSEKAGFDTVNQLLHSITLTEYPQCANELLALRRKINAMILA